MKVFRCVFEDGCVRDYKDIEEALEWLEIKNAICEDVEADSTTRVALRNFMNGIDLETHYIQAAAMHKKLVKAEWVEKTPRKIDTFDYKGPSKKVYNFGESEKIFE